MVAKLLVTALALSATAIVSAEVPRNWLDLEEPSSDSLHLLQTNAKFAVNEAKLNHSEKMEVKTSIVTAVNHTANSTAEIVALEQQMTTMPTKNKVTLMIIELIPLLGCLGVDRLYLECTISGLIKLAVCIFTCFIGGVIWGAIDGIAILFNALTSQTVLNTLGMAADFSGSNIHAAMVLGWVTLGLWIAFGICGCLFHKDRPKKAETGLPAGAAMFRGTQPVFTKQ